MIGLAAVAVAVVVVVAAVARDLNSAEEEINKVKVVKDIEVNCN